MNPPKITTRASALVIGLAVVGVLITLLVTFVSAYLGYSNAEIRLRNAITAKQRDNTSELDNMQKKISQVAQVTEAQAEAIQKLVRTSPEGSLLVITQSAYWVWACHNEYSGARSAYAAQRRRYI